MLCQSCGKRQANTHVKTIINGELTCLLYTSTNQLDLDSITAVNNGLIDFKGILLFASHDHQFVQTIANRIIEITDDGIIDRMTTFDEYLEAMGKN